MDKQSNDLSKDLLAKLRRIWEDNLQEETEAIMAEIKRLRHQFLKK